MSLRSLKSDVSVQSGTNRPDRLSAFDCRDQIARETLVMLLGGGRGERLLPLTTSKCKPGLPFAGQYRIIDFTLSNCVNSGLRRIGVLTQFKSQSLQQHIQTGWNLLSPRLNEFVDVIPAQQQKGANWYAGTADALYQNLPYIQSHAPNNVLILAGDHIYQADYRRMIACHKQSDADITVAHIAVPASCANQFGILRVAGDGRVSQFDEKPGPAQCAPDNEGQVIASMGIYLFKRHVLEELLMRDAESIGSTHDFGNDILPSAIHTHRVVGYAFDQGQQENYWQDVGTLDAYYSAHMSLLKKNPSISVNNTEWPLLANPTPWPPTLFISDNQTPVKNLVENSIISSGCSIGNTRIIQSVLSPGVCVQSGSEVRQSVVLPNVHIGKRCKINRAIVDEGSVIPDDTIIDQSLANGREFFHVTKNGVTVVKITSETMQQVITRKNIGVPESASTYHAQQ